MNRDDGKHFQSSNLELEEVWMIHKRGGDIKWQQRVQGQGRAHQCLAAKGKVAPVTGDICNIHTSNYHLPAEKRSPLD